MHPGRSIGRAARAAMLAAFVLLAGASARAQTIADALEHAWRRHPAAAALEARTSQAQAAIDVASRRTPGPGGVSVSALSDRLNRDLGKTKWEFEYGVPLWLPGQQAARQAQASRALDGVAATRGEVRLQIAAELRERWWALALARDARDQALRRAATARDLQEIVSRRHSAGDLSRMDENLARAERLSAEAEVADREAEIRREEDAFRALTGIEPPDALAPERPAASAPAVDEHPLLAAAHAAVELARASLDVSRSSRRGSPQVSVFVERERGDRVEPFSNAVGLKLAVPLRSEPLIRQREYGALADLQRAEAELARLALRIPLDVERARSELRTLDERIDLARQRAAFAADNLSLAERAFTLGELDLTTLLRVRASALEVEQLRSRLHLQREAAGSRLNQALGVLP